MTHAHFAMPTLADTSGPRFDTESLDEDLGEGGGWLLQLIGAVDHLRRGLRHQFTVWDALEEALREWLDERAADERGHTVPDLPWDANDPLADTLGRFLDALADTDLEARVALQQAVRRWSCRLADAVNDGVAWPHPIARIEFPPPHLLPRTSRS